MKKMIFLILFLILQNLWAKTPDTYHFIVQNQTDYMSGFYGIEDSLYFFPNKMLLDKHSQTQIEAKSITESNAHGQLLMQFAAMGQCYIDYDSYRFAIPTRIRTEASGRISCTTREEGNNIYIDIRAN